MATKNLYDERGFYGGGLAKFDPASNRLEFTDFGLPAGVLVPFDMEIGFDGDLINWP